MMKRWIWIALLLCYAAIIGYYSHQPLQLGEPPFPYFDKLLHLMEFGLFALLAWRATGRRLLAAFVLTLAFAVSDELHQAFIPTRDASALDVAADAVGASLMLGWLGLRPWLWGIFRARILGRTFLKRGD